MDEQTKLNDVYQLDTIYDFVEYMLKNDVKTRNNDTWLILQVLRKMGFDIYIDDVQLKDIPSFESITRCRRKIQNNEGKYLPSEAITQLREEKEQYFKEYFKEAI